MFARPLIVLCAVALTAGAALADEPDASRQTVVLFFTMVNKTNQPTRDVKLSATIPASSRYQQVHEVLVHPKPVSDTLDRLRQRRMTWSVGTIQPGEAATVQLLVQATLQPVEVDKSSKPDETLLPAQRMDYLRDDPTWFKLSDMRKIADEWAPNPSKDVWERARQIFRAIRTRCAYVLDHKRDSAMYVLEHKKGSCTELSFAFIGMCRARGIPARMATAWVNRDGGEPAIDTINHRWAEFWDDRYGWVPVDLARAIGHAASNPTTYNPDLYFGRVGGQYVVIRDDGLERKGHNNWAGYIAFYRGGKLDSTRWSAWLTTGDAQAERKLFNEAAVQFMRATDGDEEVKLGDWAAVDSPLARYMMLPLLGAHCDPLRREAARRLVDSGMTSVAGPLLTAARDTHDEGYRGYLVQQADRMLASDNFRTRHEVVKEIGLARVEQCRPKLEKLAENDPHWLVRWQAKNSLELLDKAKGSDAPPSEDTE